MDHFSLKSVVLLDFLLLTENPNLTSNTLYNSLWKFYTNEITSPNSFVFMLAEYLCLLCFIA